MIDHYDAVSTFHEDNANALFDAVHQLSEIYYRKLFSIVTISEFLSLG